MSNIISTNLAILLSETGSCAHTHTHNWHKQHYCNYNIKLQLNSCHSDEIFYRWTGHD